MKRGRGVWYIWSVNTVRKIAVVEARWLMISSTLLFAPPREITLSRLTREVQTTEDASPKCVYLVLSNTRRPNVTSPDYFPNLLGTLDCDGNADSDRSGEKSSLDIFFQVISVEKLMFHRTNRRLGCVGYVYVGRIY